jgi:hypothetical protein
MWTSITKANLTCQKYVCTWCGPVGSGLNYSHNILFLIFFPFKVAPLGLYTEVTATALPFKAFCEVHCFKLIWYVPSFHVNHSDTYH